MRNLVLVFGDQLDRQSAAFDGFERERDAVWMAEVEEESEHVWSHKARIVMFLSAMRHFRRKLESEGIRVLYHKLSRGSFEEQLTAAIREHQPASVISVEPGEWRVREMLLRLCPDADVRPDRHFFASHEDFEEHAGDRKQLRMEFFYREMRRRHAVLMDDAKPLGGKWNYDAENRGSFGRKGPGLLPAPLSFPPDEITRSVMALVQDRFREHPGKPEHFDFPVTDAQAQAAVADFVDHRLGCFGAFQDAMWTGQAYLYHSRIPQR